MCYRRPERTNLLKCASSHANIRYAGPGQAYLRPLAIPCAAQSHNGLPVTTCGAIVGDMGEWGVVKPARTSTCFGLSGVGLLSQVLFVFSNGRFPNFPYDTDII